MRYLKLFFFFTFAIAILSGTLLAVATSAQIPNESELRVLAKDKLNLTKIDVSNPQKGVSQTIGRIIGFFGGMIGGLAFVMYVWAGVLWLTSAGEQEKIATAGKIFIWTSLSLFAMLSTYVVVNMFFTGILQLQ